MVEQNLKGSSNLLLNEKSPYLLQHAYNPVNWFPWGEEAFKKAREGNKPVFLSIGYSTCHWCHVMARESFQDNTVAEILNESFISIKVDREERPDIDEIYITACQMMTGRAGWPLTVFMTPDKKPFFAGTYFPRGGQKDKPGLIEILERVKSLWESRGEDLVAQGEKMIQTIKEEQDNFTKDYPLSHETLETAYTQLEQQFDPVDGGFGKAPKFPEAQKTFFLLRWWHRTGNEKALKMVNLTLDSLRKGGIYDQLGYGFHRYSTDDEWLVPHFEKMLYDQALLSRAYLEGYQVTGEGKYAQTAKEIFEYVIREMENPEGGFYSAQNAESEGEEGKYFVWDRSEVIKILGEEKGTVFCDFFGITPQGNFDEKRSVLHINKTFHKFSQDREIPLKELKEILEEGRSSLLTARQNRVEPSKDDKILTSWNGLMIASLALGAGILKEPAYEKTALKAANFVLQNMTTEDGELFRRFREGEKVIAGYLDDYAFFVHGLLELYELTFDSLYLSKAVELNEKMLDLFWDEENKGFFYVKKVTEDMPFRVKKYFDSEIPSGNAIASMNLLRIGYITYNENLKKIGIETINSYSMQISRYPHVFPSVLGSLNFSLGPVKEIIITGKKDDPSTLKLLTELRERFLPLKVSVFYDGDNRLLEDLIPHLKNYQLDKDTSTAYLCENYTCLNPVSDSSKLAELLDK